MRLQVRPEDAGERLDAFLGAAGLGSRAAAAKAIEAGLVTVDGAPRAKSYRVQPGDAVEIEERSQPDEETPVELAPYGIAYEDAHLVIVDKPAGVVVHPARGHRHGTLSQTLALRGLAAGGEDPDRAGIVHRLDRDTSGLLVVARDDATHAALQAAMKSRRIRREYLALVEGRPPARTGTIDAPLGRDRRVRTRISTDTDEPREAVTHFEIERALPETTLLRVRLETGRTHQIRAHLKAIGFAVCGDPEYGSAGRFGLERQFLHAARLAFPHPVTGADIDVASPLPADLQAALDRADA